MEPWGFEPQIQPCHGRVIPFHYGPGFSINLSEDRWESSLPVNKVRTTMANRTQVCKTFPASLTRVILARLNNGRERRMNIRAATKGFEQWVGKQTTIVRGD